MAEILGPSTLMDKLLPTGIDYTRMAEWRFQDGVSYEELANRLALAIGDANERMAAKWGFLFSFTKDPSFEYNQGGAVTPMPELTDVTRPKPTKGELIGHMVDSHLYGDAIAGSRQYWKRARARKVQSDIATIVQRGIWRFELNLLGRFFSNAEIQIGGAGYNVPFVRGTGGTIDYAPPAYDGVSFDTTHDHFIGYNASTPKTFADVFEGLAAELEHHGHTAPYTAFVSRLDKGTINALANIVKFIQIPGLIMGGTSVAGTQFFSQQNIEFGHFADYQTASGLIHLVATSRLPTGFVGMFKSYGQLDVRNPLAVFTHPDTPFGIALVPQTLPNDDVPIQQIDIEFEFGVSIGSDRTNGTVGKLVAGGAYGNPTIT